MSSNGTVLSEQKNEAENPFGEGASIHSVSIQGVFHSPGVFITGEDGFDGTTEKDSEFIRPKNKKEIEELAWSFRL